MPTTRSPSPSRYNVSVVSSVRQTMRRGYIACRVPRKTRPDAANCFPMTTPRTSDRVFAAVESATDEIVDFTAALIRIPTVNPPGEFYPDCARLIGARLAAGGFEIEYHAAEGRAEHTASFPRLNVVGTRAGRSAHPNVHLNGHFDVVPAGAGWTLDPF